MSTLQEYWDGTWELDEISFDIPTSNVSGLVAQSPGSTYNYGSIRPGLTYEGNVDQNGSWTISSDIVVTLDGVTGGNYQWYDNMAPEMTTDKTYKWDLEAWWTGSNSGRYPKSTDTVDMTLLLAHNMYGPMGVPGDSSFIFSNKRDLVIADGAPAGNGRVRFGIYSEGQQGMGRDPVAPNTGSYANTFFGNHDPGSVIAYVVFKRRLFTRLVNTGPRTPWDPGPQCGGTIPDGRRYPRPERGEGGSPGEGGNGGSGNGTFSTVLSCGDCGPCKVTSKPWLVGKLDEFGIPSTIEQCNVTVSPVSGETCSALLYIYAPVKQEDYRVTQILFWAAIDKNGKLVGLSDPIYTDILTDTTENDYIMSLPTSLKYAPKPNVPADQFNTYELRPLIVNRTTQDTNNLREEIRTPSSSHDDEMRMWYLKDGIGTLEFNPVTQKFQNVNLTTRQFTTLSRTFTGAKYDEMADYSMLYCPSDGTRPYKPLTLADNTQLIGWENQGGPFMQHVCYDIEWLTIDPSLTGYNDFDDVVPAGLDPAPTYKKTANTRPLTGYSIDVMVGQGGISLGRGLSRPRGRESISTGSMSHHHHDHQARRYDMYSNTDNVINTDVSWKDVGYLFSGRVPETSGKMFSISRNFYPETTVPSVTSNRMISEFGSSSWDIADFTMFTGLSAQEFGLFLHAFSKLSLHSPLTASYAALEMIGYCTYNGALTAADGKYYCAAIARGNIPTWCESVTGIGTASPGFENFVICTSGCDLVLPYIAYRDYP